MIWQNPGLRSLDTTKTFVVGEHYFFSSSTANHSFNFKYNRNVSVSFVPTGGGDYYWMDEGRRVAGG